VLFLDEPTDGVDPVGRKQIRDLLLAERARGVTIFLNSHLLGEVEQLCDRVAILKKGQLALVGTVPEVVGDKSTWLVGFDGLLPRDHTWQSGRLIPSSTAGLWRLSLDSADGIDRFLDEARGRGLLLRHLERERGTLEEIYLQLADAGGPSS
jgi:ABC-2 type transport system ATP-binding protein